MNILTVCGPGLQYSTVSTSRGALNTNNQPSHKTQHKVGHGAITSKHVNLCQCVSYKQLKQYLLGFVAAMNRQ